MNGEEKKEEENTNFHMNNNAESKANNNAENNQNPIIEFINEFKFIEPDAPDSSVSLRISKNIKNINGKEKKYTKKTFLLKNGINHVIEVEEE